MIATNRIPEGETAEYVTKLRPESQSILSQDDQAITTRSRLYA